MSTLQRTIDMFQDNSPIGALQQDFMLLFASTEKVRRGCFAKNDANKKELMKHIEAIHTRLDRIEKTLNLDPINEESNIDDLPILQLVNSSKC